MKNIKNNKGFMLVEVIIVTVVVVMIMTTLYLAFNRVYNVFELKSKYTDIDAIYAIKTVCDQLIDDLSLNEKMKNAEEDGYVEIIINPDDINNNYTIMFNQYKINRLFLIKKEGISSESEWPSGINQTFKDYFSYLNNSVINDDTSDYLFVVETYEDISDKNILNKYAYLEVK